MSLLGMYDVTEAWTNIVSTIAGASGVNCAIQNHDDNLVQVVFGGSQPSETDKTYGVLLAQGDSVLDKDTAIWVRRLKARGQNMGVDGSSRVAVILAAAA